MPGRTATHHKQDETEDKVSSIVVIFVCLLFLGYIGFQVVLTGKANKETNGQQPARSTAPVFLTKYDCPLHDGDSEACVKAQTSGKGCSWYSDCRKCIVGSHDGKTREEICN